MYSGFPEDCLQESEKELYVYNVNKGMSWTDPEDQLDIKDVEDNVALRNFYKLLMVTMFILNFSDQMVCKLFFRTPSWESLGRTQAQKHKWSLLATKKNSTTSFGKKTRTYVAL